MGTEGSRQVILPFFRTSRPDQFWPPTLALLGELVFLPSPQTPAQPQVGMCHWDPGTLEPFAYTRASSAEFCYPILG